MPGKPNAPKGKPTKRPSQRRKPADETPSKPLKVGKMYKFPDGRRKYQYREIPFKDGWAPTADYLPADYDMMHLKCDKIFFFTDGDISGFSFFFISFSLWQLLFFLVIQRLSGHPTAWVRQLLLVCASNR